MTSVVIPVYNGAAILPTTVPAVLASEGADEIIWVDDGSTDQTANVLRRLTAHDLRASIVAHEINRGRSAARNRGAEVARGKRLVFLDADVEPGPGSIRGLAESLSNDAIASVCRFEPVPTNPGEPYQDYATSATRGPDPGLEVGSVLEWRYFLTGACAVTREAFEAAGRFPESVLYGEDVSFGAALQTVRPRGLRLAGPPVRLHDIGDLERAIANAEAYGSNMTHEASHALERYAAAAPLASAGIPVLQRVISWLPAGRARRKAVRYLLASVALAAFDRARDSTPSA